MAMTNEDFFQLRETLKTIGKPGEEALRRIDSLTSVALNLEERLEKLELRVTILEGRAY